MSLGEVAEALNIGHSQHNRALNVYFANQEGGGKYAAENGDIKQINALYARRREALQRRAMTFGASIFGNRIVEGMVINPCLSG